MSCLHLSVMCLDRYRSVCTVSTDPTSKKTWWERRILSYKVHCRPGDMRFGGGNVTLEGCLGRTDKSINCRSLSKWASYKSMNLILNWMADLSCARASIKGQELPGSASYSLAMKTWAMSQYSTLWDADLRCARTSIICQQNVTVQAGTVIPGNNRRKIRVVRKELCYGKAEMLEDVEEAARWWRYNLGR